MNPAEKIPFLDLVTPHQEMEQELVAVFRKILETAGFVGGPMVEEFEREFAHFCETRYCAGVGSGTDALRFALMAAGVNSGDVVITVPLTFIATTEAISQAGARPDFVDIDERTYTMDPGKLREFLETQCEADTQTGRTIHRKTGRPVVAVIPVHLYGQTADMDSILELADTYKLTVIEDACQAHGAKYFSKKENRWRTAGSMGRAAAFSFYPGKNLGACGEAGAVTTNDEEVAKKVRILRDHGQTQKYHHEVEGYNGRLDALQAGILRLKLAHLSDWNQKRRELAHNYDRRLAPMADRLAIPFEPPWAQAIYHLYVIRVPNRDQLREHLAAAGIGTGIHYPIPLHLLSAYKHLGYKQGSFPVTEQAASQVVSLPMYPQLDFKSQNRVVHELFEFISKGLPEGAGSEAIPTVST